MSAGSAQAAAAQAWGGAAAAAALQRQRPRYHMQSEKNELFRKFWFRYTGASSNINNVEKKLQKVHIRLGEN